MAVATCSAAQDFNDGLASGFLPDVGTWSVSGGRYAVSPATPGGDAVSVFYVDNLLPQYFEVKATINVAKPLAGAKANAYVVFDYQSPTSFKFAGLDLSRNKVQIGSRDASGWKILVERPASLKPDTDYPVLLSINGTVATFLQGNQSVSHTFAVRTEPDGSRYGLNAGMVGLGAQNATGRIDNVAVQVLPPQYAVQETEDFGDGVANRFLGLSTGSWSVPAGRYRGTPNAGTEPALSIIDFGLSSGLGANSVLELRSTFNVATNGGIVFDAYAVDDFKFIALLPGTGQVIIGHRSAKQGWVNDAVKSIVLAPGVDYNVNVTLVGTTVSVSINGQVALSYAFSAPVVDGGFGVFSRTGTSSFDSFTFLSNDPNLAVALSPPVPQAAVSALTLRSATTLSDSSVNSNADSTAPSQPLLKFNEMDTALDVNQDGILSALDALLVVNYLNGQSLDGLGRLSLDVNKDSSVTPLDVLLVINQLNVQAAAAKKQLAAIGVQSPTGAESETDRFFFSTREAGRLLLDEAADEDVVAVLAEDQNLRGPAVAANTEAYITSAVLSKRRRSRT